MASNSTAPPTITPLQRSNVTALPPTGSTSNVDIYMPLGVYSNTSSPFYSSDFISGAVDQVSYVYHKLGGNVLDIELQERNVYAAYEQAVMEYNYIINMHQAENVLSDMLGNTSGTFDHDGNIKDGPLSASLSGTHVNLKFPKFGFAYARRIADGLSTEAALGGLDTEYSASITVVKDQQDYDLQKLIAEKPEFQSIVGDNRILVSKVFYKSNRAAWRFYGYYGGLTTVGNFHNYGQWADDSTFEVIPVWQNKLQAIQYENAIYTRLSHWSYELKNNKLRIYPPPKDNFGFTTPQHLWIRFYVNTNAWDEDPDRKSGIDGINNMNTLPFSNIPFENINAIGKEFIRNYAFSLCMETLGYVRSKLDSIPIPGGSVRLNGPELISQAKEEQNRLRDQLRENLDKITYSALMASDAEMAENADRIQQKIPMPIKVG